MWQPPNPPKPSTWARIKAAFSGSSGMQHPQVNSWSSNLLPRTRYNYAREVGTGRHNSIVMPTILWAARNFPEAPLRVYDVDIDGNQSVVPQHGLYPILKRPNPFYSGILLWYATVIDFISTGNAYWLKVPSGAGRTVELWWAPAAIMEPTWPKSGDEYLDGYNYKPDPNKDPIRLDVTEVVHFRYGLDPDNSRKGLSPLASVLREVFTDDEAANFSASLVRNVGVPGVVISPKEGSRTDKSKAEGVKQSFIEKFGGDRRGEPMVVSAPTDITVVSFSPKDMELTGLRRVPEERITAAIGIPAVVVGMGAGLDRMIFNNMEEAKASAYENGIIPIQNLFAAEIDVQLLPDVEGFSESQFSRFDVSQVRVLQEDLNALELRLRGGLQAGGVRRSEYRAAQNLEVNEADDVYYIRADILEVPVGEMLSLPATATAGIGDFEFKGVKASRLERSLVRRLRRDAADLASEFADDMERVFANVTDNVVAQMRSQIASKAVVGSNGHGLSSTTNLVVYKASTGEEDFPEDWPEEWIMYVEHPETISRIVNADEIMTSAQAAYEDQYTNIIERTAGTVSDSLGINFGVNLDDPIMRRIIMQGGTRAGLVDIPGQTRDAIFAALEEARGEGLGPLAAIKRIEEFVDGRGMYPGIWQRKYEREVEKGTNDAMARQLATRAASRFRAETITRTETKHAQNVSAVTVYEASNVVDSCRVYDGDDCGWTSHDDPEKANGMIVSFEDARTYTLAHPRCVRDFAPVLKEL